MKYKFTNTEINNKKASEFETKAMLYLLGMRDDSEEIELVTIDCFNDVTGINQNYSKLWDVQSKNHKTLPPSKIGESLLTLYKNYISEIEFHEYILFIPGLEDSYLQDRTQKIYKYDNINEKQRVGIEKKIIDKINVGTDKKKPVLLDDFLNSIVFVEDQHKISEYIKKLSHFKDSNTATDILYESIFSEIRDAQSVLKNTYIENFEISDTKEVLGFNRHITKKDISTLIISRLIGIEVFSFKGIPIPFHKIIRNRDEDEIEDILQNCNSNLSRAFFDKNGCLVFWKVSELLILQYKKNPELDITEAYRLVVNSIKMEHEYLDEITLLYMASLVKEGIKK